MIAERIAREHGRAQFDGRKWICPSCGQFIIHHETEDESGWQREYDIATSRHIAEVTEAAVRAESRTYPSREDVARAVREHRMAFAGRKWVCPTERDVVVHEDDDDFPESLDQHLATAILALPGRTEVQIKAEALREAAEVMVTCKDQGHWNLRHEMDSEASGSPDVWLRWRADELERGEGCG